MKPRHWIVFAATVVTIHLVTDPWQLLTIAVWVCATNDYKTQ